MSATTLSGVRIRPAGHGIDALDFLIGDLRNLHGSVDHDGSVSIGIAQAIERNLLKLLDDLSPEIRRAIAEFERYRDVPKIGDRR